MEFNKGLYFRCMEVSELSWRRSMSECWVSLSVRPFVRLSDLKGKLNTLSEEMDDNDVIRVFNEIHDGDQKSSRKSSKTPQTSFIFSLKNRVGGLARALRIFQVGSQCPLT